MTLDARLQRVAERVADIGPANALDGATVEALTASLADSKVVGRVAAQTGDEAAARRWLAELSEEIRAALGDPDADHASLVTRLAALAEVASGETPQQRTIVFEAMSLR